MTKAAARKKLARKKANKKPVSRNRKPKAPAPKAPAPEIPAEKSPAAISANEFTESLSEIGAELDRAIGDQFALTTPDPENPGVGVAKLGVNLQCEALLKKYQEIRNCEQILEDFKSQAKALETSILQIMAASDLRAIKLQSGQLFSAVDQTFWRLPTIKDNPELREQAIEWLAQHGGDYLLKPSVNYKAAESFIKELATGVEGVSEPIEIPENLFKKTVQRSLSVPGKHARIRTVED